MKEIFNHRPQVKVQDIYTVPVFYSDSRQAINGVRNAINNFFYASQEEARDAMPQTANFNKFRVTVVVEQVQNQEAKIFIASRQEVIELGAGNQLDVLENEHEEFIYTVKVFSTNGIIYKLEPVWPGDH